MCTPDGMVEVREDRECNGTCVPLMVWWRCEKMESVIWHMCTPDGMVEVREDGECNGTCVPLMVWWRCEKTESVMAHVYP